MYLSIDKEYKVKLPDDNSNIISLDEHGYANLIFRGYIDNYYKHVNMNKATGLLFYNPYDEEPIVIDKSAIKTGDILPVHVPVITKKSVISNKYQRSRVGGMKSRIKRNKSKKIKKIFNSQA